MKPLVLIRDTIGAVAIFGLFLPTALLFMGFYFIMALFVFEPVVYWLSRIGKDR